MRSRGPAGGQVLIEKVEGEPTAASAPAESGPSKRQRTNACCCADRALTRAAALAFSQNSLGGKPS
eukprot:COSAG06_NODE_1269_length_10057_cov_2.547846_2_plen_66_part_00